MLGAIIGDLAGSIYEFDQIKNFREVSIDKIIEDNAFFSDDTILTIAVADAIINKCDYGEKLRKWAKKYKNYIPKFQPYFKTPFSPGFTKWVKGDLEGTSTGNGAMMRVSPVGFLFNTEEEVAKNAYLATRPSHNSEEAISCAKIIASVVFYARMGFTKEQIRDKLNLKIRKPDIQKFNYTCHDTIDVCLYSFFNANSFEEAISIAISFGGDTDTNASIVGGMAEAMYGIDENLKRYALSKLPAEFVPVLEKAYQQVKNFKCQKSCISLMKNKKL